MTKLQGCSAENETQNPIGNDGGHEINNGPVPNNTVIVGQRNNAPVPIITYNTGQQNSEPETTYNDPVSNYTPAPNNTNIGGKRKNLPVLDNNAPLRNYMPVPNITIIEGQRNDAAVPNYNSPVRKYTLVVKNTNSGGHQNNMPVPNYNAPFQDNTDNRGKPQAGRQHVVQESCSAENDTQNPVGNNGGQQNIGSVKNAPVPNNTRKRGRPEKGPVQNDTSKGKTQMEVQALIDEVKDSIEKCMRIYVTKDQVAFILQRVKGFDPEIIKMVWDGLEESNPDYFKAYSERVVLCDQISKFNELLQQQANLMEKQRAESTASNFLAPPPRMNGNTLCGLPQSNINNNLPDTSEGADNGRMKSTKEILQSPDLPQWDSSSTDGGSNAAVDSTSI